MALLCLYLYHNPNFMSKIEIFTITILARILKAYRIGMKRMKTLMSVIGCHQLIINSFRHMTNIC